MVMGKGTYEVLARDWTGQTHCMSGVDAAVRTSSSPLQKTDWNNSELIKGSAVSEIRALKEQPVAETRSTATIALHELFRNTIRSTSCHSPSYRSSGTRSTTGSGRRQRASGSLNSRKLPEGVVVSRYRVNHSPADRRKERASNTAGSSNITKCRVSSIMIRRPFAACASQAAYAALALNVANPLFGSMASLNGTISVKGTRMSCRPGVISRESAARSQSATASDRCGTRSVKPCPRRPSR